MIKSDSETKNLKLRFLVEGTEIDVPEHFHLFSVVVENYIKTYLVDDKGTPKDGGDTVIPLSNFKMDHLQLIYDFFYALQDHPPRVKVIAKDSDDISVQQSGSAHAVENDGDESVNGAVVDEESVNNEAPDASSYTPAPKKITDFSHLSSDIKVSHLPDWANEFFDKVPKERLFQASLLANFLLAHPFIEHAAFYIANKLKSMKTIQEMRDYLNAKKDFKPDEFDLLKNDPDWRERLLKEGLIEDEGQTAQNSA